VKNKTKYNAGAGYAIQHTSSKLLRAVGFKVIYSVISLSKLNRF